MIDTGGVAMQPNSLREAVFQLAREHYSIEAEFLWARTPTYGVLRHPNGKWYAVVMDIPKCKIGLPGNELIDVVNLQVDPLMSGSLRAATGIFPGYHMNKEKWITVLLDGTISMEQIAILLDISYDIAGAKSRRKKKQSRM